MTSTIPAAIDGLLALLTSQPALAAPVEIIDGQPTTQTPIDYVAVGIADGDNPSVDGSQDWSQTGMQRRKEDYTIRCEVSSWSGSGTTKERRDQAFALFAACEAALRADPTLNASVIQAEIAADFSVIQTRTKKGPVCTINFTVHVQITRM